jgi:hypothetical protein
MDTLPLSVAREVRSVAWRQAWMAANEMANFPFDAAADKAAVIEHFEALKLEVSRLSLALSDDVLTDIRLLALNASWYAAYERQGRVAAAAQAKAEFENLALALSLAKDEMSEAGGRDQMDLLERVVACIQLALRQSKGRRVGPQRLQAALEGDERGALQGSELGGLAAARAVAVRDGVCGDHTERGPRRVVPVESFGARRGLQEDQKVAQRVDHKG